MRYILLILLWFCISFPARSQPTSDTLALDISGYVTIIACATWIEDGTGLMTSVIKLPIVPLSELQPAQAGVGKTAFKVNFQCSYQNILDIYEDGGFDRLSVRFTARSEIDPTTQILKNDHARNTNGAEDIGFLIRDSANNAVQFENDTDPSDWESSRTNTVSVVCEHIGPQYQPAPEDVEAAETKGTCSSYSFPYTVEYATYGDSPGPGLVDADATVTVDWQ